MLVFRWQRIINENLEIWVIYLQTRIPMHQSRYGWFSRIFTCCFLRRLFLFYFFVFWLTVGIDFLYYFVFSPGFEREMEIGAGISEITRSREAAHRLVRLFRQRRDKADSQGE